MPEQENIKALINLLTQEPARARELGQKLALIIKDNPQKFDRFIEAAYGGNAPGAVAQIMQDVRRGELLSPLRRYWARPAAPLGDGMALLARFINPAVKEADIAAPLAAFKAALGRDIDGSFDIFHKAEIFARVIFGSFGFKLESLGADARLLSLPDMLRRRRASAFAMAAMYALLAQDFDILADVSDSAGKPVVRLRDNISLEPVYVDICANGRYVGEDDCHTYAAMRGGEWNPAVLRPMTNPQLLRRLMANLVFVYAKQDANAADMLRAVLKEGV